MLPVPRDAGPFQCPSVKSGKTCCKSTGGEISFMFSEW